MSQGPIWDLADDLDLRSSLKPTLIKSRKEKKTARRDIIEAQSENRHFSSTKSACGDILRIRFSAHNGEKYR